MRPEQNNLRVLTPSERRIAIAVGAGMLLLSFLSLMATMSLYMPLHKLVEGLSK
jgi:hypothetical protein